MKRKQKEARFICAWLRYNNIEIPDRLYKIAVDKQFMDFMLPYDLNDVFGGSAFKVTMKKG